MYKKLGDSIKEASVIIILFSLAKQIIYYSSFGIPISYFTSISELWLSITDDFFIVVPFIIFLLWIFDWANKKENSPNEDYSIKPKPIEIIVLVAFIIFVTTYCIYYYIISNDGYIKRLMLIMLVAIFFNTCFIIYTIKSKQGLTYSLQISLGLFAILVLISLNTNFSIRDVEKGKYTGTIIKTADSSYISNDTSYFIGKTSEYVFIYNKLKKSTTIIPTSKIENIILVSK